MGELGDVQTVLAIGFLFLIILCQAALNLWFIFKNESFSKTSTELAVLARQIKEQTETRADEMAHKLEDIEKTIGRRLDANIEILEKIITGTSGSS